MNISEFILATTRDESNRTRPAIVCVDGFKMSVQGSSGHYCTPRSCQDYYTEMEIGFPSEKQDELMKYAEDKDNPTDTVYGWVPCDLIDKIIEKHGGVDLTKTFKH